MELYFSLLYSVVDIEFVNREKLICNDKNYEQFIQLLKNEHMHIIHVRDKKGFVWDDTKPYKSIENALEDLEKYLAKWIKKSLRKKYKLSMKLFLKEGMFGHVGIGTLRKEVERSFGKPTIYTSPSSFGYLKATEWHYGNIEFYFDINSDKLSAILIRDAKGLVI